MLGMVLWLSPEAGPGRFVCWMVVLSVLVMDALSEHPDFTASVLRPFRRLGPLRGAVGMLLLPGWACGVFYTGLLIVVTLVLSMTGVLFEESNGYQIFAITVLWIAGLLGPAAIRVWFLAKMRNPLAGYIVVLLAMLVVGVVFFIIAESTNTSRGLLIGIPITPVCGIMAMEEYRFRSEADTAIVLAILTAGVYWVAIYLRSLPHRKRIRMLDEQLALTPKPERPPADVA